MPRPTVAAFDVDETLTIRDCVVPFLLRVGGRVRLVAGLARRVRRAVPALVRGDRDTLKALAADSVFAGRPAGGVDLEGKQFAEEIVRSWLRPEAVEQVRRHQARGDTTVLVSASFTSYLVPLGGALGFDGVLGTELEVGDDGRCTGRLVDGNCRGQEKVRRLDVWLDANVGGRDAVEVWAYGDSSSDRELLASADVGTLVGRDPMPEVPA